MTTTITPGQYRFPAGWYADPARQHDERYWTGDSWTARVRDGDVEGYDPL